VGKVCKKKGKKSIKLVSLCLCEMEMGREKRGAMANTQQGIVIKVVRILWVWPLSTSLHRFRRKIRHGRKIKECQEIKVKRKTKRNAL